MKQLKRVSVINDLITISLFFNLCIIPSTSRQKLLIVVSEITASNSGVAAGGQGGGALAPPKVKIGKKGPAPAIK